MKYLFIAAAAAVVIIAVIIIAAVRAKSKRITFTEERGGSGIERNERDRLTGVLSLEGFCADAEECIRMYPGSSFAFMRTSIGNIGAINTAYGRETGNNVLRTLARTLCEMDDHIIVGRDRSKFVYMTRYEDTDKLYAWLEALHNRLENIGAAMAEKPKVFIHTGFIATDGKLISMTVPELIACAKIAESDASKRTHTSCVRYTEQLRIAAEEDELLERDMADALKKNEFAVFLQPKFDARTNAVVGAKIMSMWHHPKMGAIGSYRYVPLFIKNGFILDLDMYLLEQACKLLRGWLDAGKKAIELSINVPRMLITSQKSMDACVALKKKYDIPDRLLELEFSERLVDDNIASIQRIFEFFRQNGMLCSVENFGSGRGSLRTVTNFSIDSVKFSRDFFEKGYLTEEEQAQLGEVIAAAKKVGVVTSATGVTEGCMEPLRALGCDVIQGAVDETPFSAADFEAKYL